MCGRFSITVPKKGMLEHLKNTYGITEFSSDIELPRYNISPGQEILALINDGKVNRAGTIKWGFIPSFQKGNMREGIINAKAETLQDKPAFKESFQSKRCILLADGFYEWKKTGGPKTPHWITLDHNQIFPMAGLWSVSVNADGTKQFTCGIITTEANELMSAIHDRMPVILTEESCKTWLNPQIKDTNLLSSLLVPYDSQKMHLQEVSSYVNSSKNEGMECISKR